MTDPVHDAQAELVRQGLGSYLRAKVGTLYFERALQDMCREPLHQRQTRIGEALGAKISLEETKDFKAYEPESTSELWAWVGMEGKFKKIGWFYAGIFWDGRQAHEEVQAFASLAFDRKTDYERARGILIKQIGEGGLTTDIPWLEIFHYRVLANSDFDKIPIKLSNAVDRWMELLTRVGFAKKFHS